MGATFPRVKIWAGTEDVLTADLNGEFQNVLDNFTPAGLDDYSVNATQMQIQTSPGAQGSESLATSGAGEIARLRYVINRVIGGTYWYDAPASSISELSSLLNSSVGVPRNRILSGRTRSATDAFPIFLVPHGTNATVTLKGASTNFKVYIDATLYTVTTDISQTGMSLAPSTNNTCLVNDSAFASQAETKHAGSSNSTLPVITIDTVGSEISALVGKFAAFKTSTEYFVAFVNSATQLTNAIRGLAFDSADAPIERVALADNDTITLMKLHWTYYKTDGTVFSTTNNPTFAAAQPTSPASGDMWFDLTNQTWKQYNGSAFVAANAHLIGWAITDTSGCKAARSFDVYAGFSDVQTGELLKVDSNTVKLSKIGSRLSVNGTLYSWDKGVPSWNTTDHLESGTTDSASVDLYVYVTERGALYLSKERPYDRRSDLFGHYHPYHMWRAVGFVSNDGSSNFGTPVTYGQRYLRSQTFTSNGTWWASAHTDPQVLLEGFGGGGGGSGGGTTNSIGGGGGAGSSARWYQYNVVPYTGYAVVLGSGGAGGAAATSGSDGTDTTFGGTTISKGGRGARAASVGMAFSPGGCGPIPGGFGSTVSGGTGSPGGNSPYATGGSAGSAGGAGGAGGGGGAGAGAGANGGATQTVGASAAANTGAGGGGGGSADADVGAAGGSGGSGRLTVFWYEYL